MCIRLHQLEKEWGNLSKFKELRFQENMLDQGWLNERFDCMRQYTKIILRHKAATKQHKQVLHCSLIEVQCCIMHEQSATFHFAYVTALWAWRGDGVGGLVGSALENLIGKFENSEVIFNISPLKYPFVLDFTKTITFTNHVQEKFLLHNFQNSCLSSFQITFKIIASRSVTYKYALRIISTKSHWR